MRKNILTTIGVIILVVIVFFLFTRESSEEKISNAAIEFLQEKYGREFSFRSYEHGDLLSKIDYIHCTTDNLDPEHESVTVYVREEDGNLIFHDDYFSYLIRPKMEEYITDIVKEEFPNVKVYAAAGDGYESNELTDKSTLSDLYETNSRYIAQLKVYVKGDSNMTQVEYDRKMQNIRKKLVDSKHIYFIYLFVVNPEIYDKIERYEQQDFWDFYIVNREPDGKNYYYGFHEDINY